ncbi:alkene reductase [Entomomonas asaccharolytica]|uniref:Alkene reductase n=1 Tax=Entomomonas asaccharolytica TaxID=2785331 RepID=A0A974RXF1_9GAMM|nr:alkene reductase [Entomomonas asaccharolytica]QQP86122.1 alkene reductase [Entomomonas asaccharolytica]
MNSLFNTVKIGPYNLKNRLVMAPMTRARADNNGVPTDLVTTYYAQRASAGLIISECVYPSAMGKGYIRSPGICNEQQVAAWKKVTDVVHAKGGLIFMQINHCGRISHPSLLPNKATPVAPSAIKPAGQSWTDAGLQDFVTPHELTETEIKQVINEYRQATKLALQAGFDGVELHAASGYLAEQFLSSGSNQRQDNYGGSVENRCRFVIETLQAMIAEAGSNRVGIKISPEMNFNDIHDDNPQQTYSYLVKQINPLNLAYLHVALFGTPVDYHGLLKPLFDNAYLIGSGLTKETAQNYIANNQADAVVFGSAFLANPDLPERFKQNAALNTPDKDTFYSGGAEGYIDYPTLG